MADTKTKTAEVYLEETPEHIVLFERPSEKNTALLSKVLNTEKQKNSSARAGRVVLQSKGGVHSRVYTRLGVAATTLSEDEIAELEADDKVVKVFKNERRTIPPIFPQTTGAGTGEMDSLDSYLRGMRDALDSIMKFRQGENPMLPSPVENAEISGKSVASAAQNFSWCLNLIGMNSNYSKATGKNVFVAVLDTGIDLSHPDFSHQNFVDNVNVKSFVPNEGVQDGNGHGTHCAGVIAGLKKPGIGQRYSVAPDAKLIIGKVLDDSGSGFDDQIIDAMDWAQEQGAKIISMSLGSPRGINESYSDLYEEIAVRLLEDGVLVVAAAGNESNRPYERSPVGNPAACPSILSVGAVDRNQKVAYFSCAELDKIGTLDVCAPGLAVLSAWTGGGYQSISGTSMATPHVAGIAALFAQAFPTQRGRALASLLLSRAQRLPLPSRDVGAGMVQAP
jgi:subtilisin family serine protease